MTREPDNRTAHPGLVDIEAFRTGEASREVIAHLAACPECREWLGRLGTLAAEVRRSREAVPELPVTLDETLQTAIAARAAVIRARESRRRRVRGVAVGLSAAAAVLLAVLLLVPGPWRGELGYTRHVAAACPEDVDASGRVDIVDAYLMARRIAGGTAPPDWDLNADGRVDRGDADALARRVVAIRKGDA